MKESELREMIREELLNEGNPIWKQQKKVISELTKLKNVAFSAFGKNMAQDAREMAEKVDKIIELIKML